MGVHPLLEGFALGVSLQQFVKSLSESGLMSVEEIWNFRGSLPPDKALNDPAQLAEELVRRGKLTAFQAKVLVEGNAAGLVFGDYVVLDRIGAGGMGEVFKARHRHMDRVVALKLLPAEAMKDPEAVERFQREVRAAAKLSHANIVTAHDAGERHGRHYLVMEFVEGRDLNWLVNNRGPLPVPEALDYVLQAARGLEYAHRKGIVHRDIKPSNLLVDPEGTVKILDMGLARLQSGPGTGDEPTGAMPESLTQSGQIMGTAAYMPPEQAEDTHRADERADVYALGCTLYKLLTGKPPYQDTTTMKMLLAHRDMPIPSLCAARSEVPETLDAAFRTMVAKRPEDRYQSMTEVIRALETCQSSRTAEPVQAAGVADAATAAWERQSAVGSAAASVQAPAAVAEGQTLAGQAMQPTVTQGRMPAAPVKTHVKRRIVIAAAAAAGFVAILLGVIFTLRTKDGTIVVEVNEAGAEVVVDDGKVTLRTPDDEEPLEIRVEPGQHVLRVTKGGFKLFTKEFSLGTRERQAIHVRLEPAFPAEPAAGPSQTAAAATAKVPPSPAEPWPGPIPKPATIPGIGRWQIGAATLRGMLLSVAWAPGGKWLAIGCSNGEIRIYDTSDWRLDRVLLGHRGFVNGLSWSPDGTLLGSVGSDGTLRIWASDGAPRKVIDTQLSGYFSQGLSWSPDGSQLATTGLWGEPRVWCVDGSPGPVLMKAGGGPHRGVAWSPDGKWIAGGSDDGPIRLWDSEGRAGPVWRGHTGEVAKLAWAPQGDRLASAGQDKTIRIWNADGKAGLVFRGLETGGFSLAWSPNGKQLASGDGTGNIRIWNGDGPDRPVLVPGNDGAVGLAWSPDSRFLASASFNSLVQISRADGTAIRSIQGRAIPAPWVGWNPKTGQLAAADPADGGGVVRLWTASGGQIGTFKPPGSSTLWAWSPDGRELAIGNSDGTVRLWGEDGKPGLVLQGHTGVVKCAAWSSDGKSIASGGEDKTVRVWGPDGKVVRVLEGHSATVNSVSWSADGKWLASGSMDGTIRLWTLDGKAGPVMKSRLGRPLAIAWSPTAPVLASSTYDWTQTWDPGGNLLKEMRNALNAAAEVALAWSPDGKTLASGGEDLTLHLWFEDGKEARILRGENDRILSVAWSGDGKQLASGTEYGTVLVHNARTGEPEWVTVLLPEATSVTFSATGQILHGDPEVMEKELIYLVETPTGAAEILKPSEFRKRFAAAAAQLGQPVPAVAQPPSATDGTPSQSPLRQ